jgi:hypothetical protein
MTITVPVPIPAKTFYAWNKQIQIDVGPSLSITLTASIGDQDAVTKAATKVAMDWHVGKAEPVLNSGTIFSNLKFEYSKTKVDVTSHTSTEVGNFTLTFTLVGISGGVTKDKDGKVKLKALQFNVTWIPATVTLPDETIGILQLTNIKVDAGGQISIGPNYEQILLNWAEKQAEEVAEEAAGDAAGGGAGEAVLAVVSFDTIMATALAAVAVGTVFGVIDMFVKKADIDHIKQSLYPALNNLNAGVYDGLANRTGSGSGDAYQAGLSLGQQAWRAAASEMSKQPDLPPPDEMQQQIADAAKKAMAHWSAWHDIDQHMRDAYFDRWLDEHHGVTTFQGDVQDAISAIYGGGPEPITGPHMQKWAAMSDLAKHRPTKFMTE